MLDVSPLVPAARPIVARAAPIYLRHTQPWFVGLLVHGSALKGGFIPGCSDIDLQLYLEDGLFGTNGQIPLPVAMAIQRELAEIDPAPFQYIQCHPRSHRPHPAQPKLLGPVPGAYHLVIGEVPIAEATATELRQQAIESLSTLNPMPFNTANNLLERGGGRLERSVRFLCTDVWPTLYHLLTVRTDDPLAVWALPKDRAITLLGDVTPLGREINAFYAAVANYYPLQEAVDDALAVIAAGVTFLEAVRAWWTSAKSSLPG